MKFGGRILAAMMVKGWDIARAPASLLRTKWDAHFRGKRNIRTPSRPVFYDWINADRPKIDSVNLFLLSDLLDVNPRWLAMNDVPMAKPFSPDADIKILLDAYDNISPAAREELITEANKLLRVHTAATRANPFPSKVK